MFGARGPRGCRHATQQSLTCPFLHWTYVIPRTLFTFETSTAIAINSAMVLPFTRVAAVLVSITTCFRIPSQSSHQARTTVPTLDILSPSVFTAGKPSHSGLRVLYIWDAGNQLDLLTSTMSPAGCIGRKTVPRPIGRGVTATTPLCSSSGGWCLPPCSRETRPAPWRA